MRRVRIKDTLTDYDGLEGTLARLPPEKDDQLWEVALDTPRVLNIFGNSMFVRSVNLSLSHIEFLDDN